MMSASMTPFAIRSTARPKLCRTAIDPTMVISSLYTRNGEKDALAADGATPNCWKVPPRRTRVRPSSMTGMTPVQSMTVSQPCGRSRSDALAPVASAPRRSAISRRSLLMSTTEREAAPAALASWSIISPMVPAP